MSMSLFFLPATSEAVAAYLAQYAESLSTSTLRTRLAGLSSWHRDHGFIDPTKSELVSRVLKGIRAAHNTPQKQARPVEFELLIQVSEWLRFELGALVPSDPQYKRIARDNAMLLIGFWRGFRSDELTRLTTLTEKNRAVATEIYRQRLGRTPEEFQPGPKQLRQTLMRLELGFDEAVAWNSCFCMGERSAIFIRRSVQRNDRNAKGFRLV